jgi:nucleolar protein 4
MMEKTKASNRPKNKAADPRTLFVKFFPPSATITRQHLSDHFSNYGPVNRCSVIRQSKDTKSANNEDEDGDNRDRGSKGYGFVRFVNEDDAKAAADEIHKKSSGGKKRKNLGEMMTVDGIEYTLHVERAVDAAMSNRKKDMSPKKKDHSGTVEAASTSIHDTTMAKRKRSSRVIIRNLSFYANEKHIKNTMESEFGEVLAVDLPLVPTLPNEDAKSRRDVPRHRGFAFVTFSNALSARKAVERGNEIKIKNRLVAIDFSVSKMVHQKMLKDDEQKKEESDSDSDSEEVDRGSEKSDADEGSKDGDESASSDSDGESADSQDEDKDSEEESDSDDSDSEENKSDTKAKGSKEATKQETPEFDESESKRTLFLRNVPFDATRRDVFDLFREFGRIQAVYLVKDPQTGVFRGTAFVRFETEKSCGAALEAAGNSGADGSNSRESSTFVSSKNIVMGLGQDGNMSGLSLKGRQILVDLAVDRNTASSLAVQRNAEGKPIKKMVGKDKRNLYLKNEGRVSSSADSNAASSAGAKHGGVWEDLPQSDRAKRERVFADKSTKLRSPLFFINPNRLSIRNLSKNVTESDLKRLVTGALKTGLDKKLVTRNDAVAHWRAGGELAHSEVMKRATDPTLVTPVFDEKNTKESIPSVYIDRDTSGGKKTADAPSRGFGFVEFTHHTHALACLRQLNNNPAYSAEFVAGGKQALELLKHQQRKGKKNKKAKVDDDEGAGFVGDDGKVCVPRLIVEFAVS